MSDPWIEAGFKEVAGRPTAVAEKDPWSGAGFKEVAPAPGTEPIGLSDLRIPGFAAAPATEQHLPGFGTLEPLRPEEKAPQIGIEDLRVPGFAQGEPLETLEVSSTEKEAAKLAKAAFPEPTPFEAELPPDWCVGGMKHEELGRLYARQNLTESQRRLTAAGLGHLNQLTTHPGVRDLIMSMKPEELAKVKGFGPAGPEAHDLANLVEPVQVAARQEAEAAEKPSGALEFSAGRLARDALIDAIIPGYSGWKRLAQAAQGAGLIGSDAIDRMKQAYTNMEERGGYEKLKTLKNSTNLADRLYAAEMNGFMQSVKHADWNEGLVYFMRAIDTLAAGVLSTGYAAATGERLIPGVTQSQRIWGHAGTLTAFMGGAMTAAPGAAAGTSAVARFNPMIRLFGMGQRAFYKLPGVSNLLAAVAGRPVLGRLAGMGVEIGAMQAGMVTQEALYPVNEDMALAIRENRPLGDVYWERVKASAKPTLEGLAMALVFGGMRNPAVFARERTALGMKTTEAEAAALIEQAKANDGVIGPTDIEQRMAGAIPGEPGEVRGPVPAGGAVVAERIPPEAPQGPQRPPGEAIPPVKPPEAGKAVPPARRITEDLSALGPEGLAKTAESLGIDSEGKSPEQLRKAIEEAVVSPARPAPAEQPAPAKGEGKHPWEMTKAEWAKTPDAGTKDISTSDQKRYQSPDYATAEEAIAWGKRHSMPGNLSRVQHPGKAPVYNWSFLADPHGRAVYAAVQEGKPVPRAVLEEYRGQPWADAALAKIEAKPGAEGGKGPRFVPVSRMAGKGIEFVSPDTVDEAVKLWQDGKLYIDNAGNWHTGESQPGGSMKRGPIWAKSKELRSRGVTPDELHKAAERRPASEGGMGEKPGEAAPERLTEQQMKDMEGEFKTLAARALKKDGSPRANAKPEDLARIAELREAAHKENQAARDESIQRMRDKEKAFSEGEMESRGFAPGDIVSAKTGAGVLQGELMGFERTGYEGEKTDALVKDKWGVVYKWSADSIKRVKPKPTPALAAPEAGKGEVLFEEGKGGTPMGGGFLSLGGEPPTAADIGAAATIERIKPRITITGKPKDIGFLGKWLGTLANQSKKSRSKAVQTAGREMVVATMEMRAATDHAVREGQDAFKSLPKEYRADDGAKFFELMDKHLSPDEIDAAPNIPETVKPVLKHFKMMDEAMRVEIVQWKRKLAEAVHSAKNKEALAAELAKREIELPEGWTNKEAAEALARSDVPDDWGRQWSHIQHAFFGDYELSWTDAAGKKYFIGSAVTPAEAYEKLNVFRKANPDVPVARLDARPRENFPMDVVRVSRPRLFAMIHQIEHAADVEAATIRDAMRGVVGARESKVKWYGPLQHREGAPGFSKDFRRVWTTQVVGFQRWKFLTALNKKVEPLIQEARAEGLRGWADHLQDTMDFLWGRKRGDASIAFDQFMRTVPIIRYYAKPFMLDRILGLVKTVNYWRHLQTGKFYVINRLQPFQTLWPVVGEKGMYRGWRLMHSKEGKALLEEHNIVSPTQRFTESWRRTPKWARWTPAGASEARNQAWAFLSLYDHGIRRGMSEPEAVRYARFRGQIFTQFAYSPADVPRLMRGPIGGLIMQYKRFTIKQLELVETLAREKNIGGIARWVTMQAVLGGYKALTLGLKVAMPFAVYAWLKRQVGEDAAQVISHGLPAFAGVDISGSIAAANPPQGRNLPEVIGNTLLGPTGQSLVDVGRAVTQTKVSEPLSEAEKGWRKFLQGSPTIQQFVYLWKALDRDTSTMDARGRQAARLEAWDLWKKTFGFRPLSETKQREQFEAIMDMKDHYDARLDAITTARLAGDEQKAEVLVNEWNDLWPEYQIELKDTDRRLEERQKGTQRSPAERAADQLPKKLRPYAEEVGVEAEESAPAAGRSTDRSSARPSRPTRQR